MKAMRCVTVLGIVIGLSVGMCGCGKREDAPKNDSQTSAPQQLPATKQEAVQKKPGSVSKSLSDQTNFPAEEREKKFFELMGMKDYLAKLNEKPLLGESFDDNPPGRIQGKPMPWFSNEFSVISDKDGNPRGWMWKVKDDKIRKLTLDEVRKACGPSTDESNGWTWWGRGGCSADDSKHIETLYVFPLGCPK